MDLPDGDAAMETAPAKGKAAGGDKPKYVPHAKTDAVTLTSGYTGADDEEDA